MTQTDFSVFTDRLQSLGAAFGARMTDRRVGAYWEALADLSWAAVDSAMAHAMRQSNRFPAPARIRELASTASRDRREQEAKQALAAVHGAGMENEAGPYCGECNDFGWIRVTYTPAIYGGVEVGKARRCACYYTNPVRLARGMW